MNPPKPPSDPEDPDEAPDDQELEDEKFDEEWRSWVSLACEKATGFELASVQRQAADELYERYENAIAITVLRFPKSLGKAWSESKGRAMLVSEIDEDIKKQVCLWATQDGRPLRGAVRGSALYTVCKVMR